MIENNKLNISRHGTFLSNLNLNHSQILIDLGNEIDLSLKKYNEKDIEILKKIKLSLKNHNISENLNPTKENNFNFSNQEFQWLSRSDKKLWLKYVIYRYKFKTYPPNYIETDYPIYLLIEPTSVCNIRCIMCFQVDKSFSTKKNYMGFMDIDLFKKIIEDAKKNDCHAITLASRGEPTLHKKFDQMMQILSDNQILDLKLNTNATVLNVEKIRGILKANFSEVVFSVDAGTKETYEKIRVMGKFDKIVENIKLFNTIRAKEFPNSPTITRIAGVKVNNEQDINQMNEFWSKLVDEVTIKESTPRWDTYNNEKNNETQPCLQLWHRMYIWYDGTVNTCDFDYKSFLSKGNIKYNSIKEIWKNYKYQEQRKEHLNNNRKKYTPCDRCSITI